MSLTTRSYAIKKKKLRAQFDQNRRSSCALSLMNEPSDRQKRSDYEVDRTRSPRSARAVASQERIWSEEHRKDYFPVQIDLGKSCHLPSSEWFLMYDSHRPLDLYMA